MLFRILPFRALPNIDDVEIWISRRKERLELCDVQSSHNLCGDR